MMTKAEADTALAAHIEALYGFANALQAVRDAMKRSGPFDATQLSARVGAAADRLAETQRIVHAENYTAHLAPRGN